jgi:putative transposase
MPNHVHLVVVPANRDGMHRALRAVHSQYAQRLNRIRHVSGHVWQGRFYSSALDARHFLNAVRYVELNPVDAGLVRKAEDYPWSSAGARCGLRHDPLIEPRHQSELLQGIEDWSSWLACGVPADCRDVLKRHEKRNLPCGSMQFVAGLEAGSGLDLQFRRRGGQRNKD